MKYKQVLKKQDQDYHNLKAEYDDLIEVQWYNNIIAILEGRGGFVEITNKEIESVEHSEYIDWNSYRESE